MLSLVVTFRPTPRRSRKSHSHRVLNCQLSTVGSQLPLFIRKSFPLISFTDPHPLTLLESYRFKNRVERGIRTFGRLHRWSSRCPGPKSFRRSTCAQPHRRLILSGLLTICGGSKSLRCNTYKKHGGRGRHEPRSPETRHSPLNTRRCSLVPLPRTPFGATIRKGTKFLCLYRETTPLLPVSKTTRADNGTSSWSPLQVVPGSSVLSF